MCIMMEGIKRGVSVMEDKKPTLVGMFVFLGLVFTLAMLTINLHFIVPG